eukprot:9482820-Pyramimonas_sp.AAC.2
MSPRPTIHRGSSPWGGEPSALERRCTALYDAIQRYARPQLDVRMLLGRAIWAAAGVVGCRGDGWRRGGGNREEMEEARG